MPAPGEKTKQLRLARSYAACGRRESLPATRTASTARAGRPQDGVPLPFEITVPSSRRRPWVSCPEGVGMLHVRHEAGM